MDFHSLLAVSPIDGRYAAKTASLRQYFSEFALIRNRVRVEVEYFIALCEIPLPQLSDFGEGTGLTRDELFARLRMLYQAMTPEDARKVKDIEKITNHDVKAVEYFIKENFKALGISRWQEFVHFGLTSQDINNTSQPLMLKEALENEYIPALKEVISILAADVEAWKDVPMLARTHGQPATPTRLGKEFQVFVARLEEQLRQFSLLTWPAKFGGATGNMNAHKVAFPDIDWPSFAEGFVASLGLKRSFPTTQIDPYDTLGRLAVSLGEHGDILPGLDIGGKDGDYLVECGKIFILKGFLQHQRLRGVVDVLRGEAEMDELLPAGYSKSLEILLDEIFNGLDIVVGDLLDVLYLLGVFRSHRLIEPAQASM